MPVTEEVKPIRKYLEEILQVLDGMIDNDNDTSETRIAVRKLYNHMFTYEFLTLLGNGRNY